MPLFKKRTVATKSKQKEFTEDLVDSDASSDDEITLVSKRIKTSKSEGSVATNATNADIGKVEYQHSGTSTTSNYNDATKQDRLAQEAREEALEKAKEAKQKNSEDYEEGIYKGKANYAKFFKAREGSVKFGPVKPAASNVRSTTVIDYQPDVCKDYKQTGFCGYGDTCKFLHSREDYKAGWQLEREWEGSKYANKHSADTTDEASTKKEDELVDVPFKCVICKEDYKDPVVTQCKHYFCEQCFFDAYRKEPGCFICGKNTSGVAMPAKDLKRLLKRRLTVAE
jgi:RING finger protein 113A